MGNNHIVCIGAALIDESFVCTNEPELHTSNPSVYYRSPGGVARNVAHHLAQLGNSVELITHFGNDTEGRWLMQKCAKAGVGLSNSIVNDISTGHYAAILSPDGNLFTGTASTHFDKIITPEYLNEKINALKSASLILIDCNLEENCIRWLLDFCRFENLPCIVETVSVQKSKKLKGLDLNNILLITPNRDELSALTSQPPETDLLKLIPVLIGRGIRYVWVRNGKDESRIFSVHESYSFVPSEVNIVDVTGAGDAALSGWIHAFIRGKSMKECLIYGHTMAELILQTRGSVLEELTFDLLESKINLPA